MSIPKLLLNNSRAIPIIGLGTWKAKPGVVAQAVKDAIDVGYRHIDCALVYGNEPEIGEGITESIKSHKVDRKDLFITSKLWSTSHSKELVMPSLKESLKNLNLDYLDLYLIHWPWGIQNGVAQYPLSEDIRKLYSDVDYLETWKAMEECLKSGLVKSIGVSNFNHKQIDRLLQESSTVPSVLQVECHPYLDQRKLFDYCKDKGIVITAYSPLGSPGREFSSGEPILLDDSKVKSLAEKYKKTPAQVLIRFQVQQGVSVIPKSSNRSRMESNFDIFDFEISEEDMKELFSLDKKVRYFNLTELSDHPHYPFHEEY